ncbi:MAG TPA: ABC transporter permease [Vicinamibacteria bacterium]|nr:ABC transporter permease [Vicinamibacteria bacterium]
MFDSLAQDVRGAARSLRRAPGLSLGIVGILGLSLAASVTTFSILNAVLLERLPYREPDRVVFLRHVYGDVVAACSPPTFLDYRQAARSFEGLAATVPWNANLVGSGEPERLSGLLVSANFFETLGTAAARGRTFGPEEERPGRDRVVVVSHGLWQRRFGGDPRLLGSSIHLDGEAYEVVGIMPPGFEWGRRYGREARGELWAPFALTPERVAEVNRGNEFLDVFGRLRAGVPAGQAQAELDVVVAGLRARHPGRYTEASGFRVVAAPLQEEIVAPLRPGLLLVLAAVLTLLLVAASNVAGLLLARAAGRRRETSVRAALGASRARLAREAVVEASVLAAVAGGAGVLLARLAVSLLERVDRVTLPRSQDFAVDVRVAGFALAATLVVALVAGLAPAWHLASHSDVTACLRAGSPVAGGREVARARRLLIVSQTALAFALLVGAGLLVRSLTRLQAVPTGFRAESVLVARVQLPLSRYREVPSRVLFLHDVRAHLTGRADVVSVAATSELPLSGESNSSTFSIEGKPVPRGENQPHAETWSASPGYFDTMGIPVMAGRAIEETDVAGRVPVAVVSEALVRRHFPAEDPIGRRIDFEGDDNEHVWRQIVGVVGDVRDSRLDRAPEPQVYVPYAQRPTSGVFLVVRTGGDPLAALPLLRSVVNAEDPALPVYDATTMERLEANDTRDRRAARTALGGFAGAAVLLAALGLYALVAQAARQRVPEIGVRMALGARRSDVVRLFLADGGTVVLQGIAAGTVLALVASHLLRGFVFGVTTTDPVTYLTVVALLSAVAVAACAVPAWRAARVEPSRALRME